MTIRKNTGYRDINNKIIRLGDIVKYHKTNCLCLGGERIAEIKYDKKYKCFYMLTTLGDGYEIDAFDVEKIGNINRNKKLLKNN